MVILSWMICCMVRRRRKREMAENLVDVVNDQTYEKSNVDKAKKLMAELESKREADKQAVRQSLAHVGQVKQVEDETVYANLFGMIVKYCVDSVLKREAVLNREVMNITFEMNQFRSNIAQGIAEDKSLEEKPLNLLSLPEGFEEAWRIWRQSDTDDRKEKSFQMFLSKVLPE